MSVTIPDLRESRIVNALSVDVEDYFQVRSFEDRIHFSRWDSFECRFGRNTRELLSMFDKHGVKATFFLLGWNGQKDPSLVREIKAAGHEIASHGWSHRLVYELNRAQFSEDASRTKSLLEDITGSAVKGFRAASYSIITQSMWALEVLAETGHLYDSSIYPIRRGVYGIASAERVPHRRPAGSRDIADFPMSTTRLGGINLPFGSGAYLRLLPFWITKGLLNRENRAGQPVIVSVHPWELDPGQPRICSTFERPNHYLRLAKTRPILENLLRSFRFDTVEAVLDGLGLLPH